MGTSREHDDTAIGEPFLGTSALNQATAVAQQLGARGSILGEAQGRPNVLHVGKLSFADFPSRIRSPGVE